MIIRLKLNITATWSLHIIIICNRRRWSNGFNQEIYHNELTTRHWLAELPTKSISPCVGGEALNMRRWATSEILVWDAELRVSEFAEYLVIYLSLRVSKKRKISKRDIINTRKHSHLSSINFEVPGGRERAIELIRKETTTQRGGRKDEGGCDIIGHMYGLIIVAWKLKFISDPSIHTLIDRYDEKWWVGCVDRSIDRSIYLFHCWGAYLRTRSTSWVYKSWTLVVEGTASR